MGWSFGGGASIFTEWTDNEDTTTYREHPWDNLYLEANYKGENVTGAVVFCNDDNGGANGNTAYVEKAWGQVDLDGFSIKLGQYDALSFNPVGSPPGKYGNTGIGATIGGTSKYNVEAIFKPAPKMSVSVMLSRPGYGASDQSGVSVSDTMMPALEASLTGFAPFMWKVFGGFESYELNGGNYNEDTVDAYIVGAVVRPKVGPAKISVGVNYSTNGYITQGSPWQYNAGFQKHFWNWTPDEDTTRLGIAGSASFKLTDMIGLTFGAGYQIFECGDDEDPMLGYYVNLPIQVTKNLRIMPYVYIEDQDTATIYGKEYDGITTTTYGAMWTINF